MVKQVKKQSAQISILSLLLSPEAHHDTLVEILNEFDVPEGTVTKDLHHIVGQIVRMNTITFNEDELTPERTGHIKFLHIAVESKDVIIPRVLIDNGFALNFCPMLTLSCIGIDYSLV